MTTKEENLVLALYDALNFINFIKQDCGEIPDNGIEENIKKILDDYSIMKFECINMVLSAGKHEICKGLVSAPVFTLHRVFSDKQKRRYSIYEFEKYAMEVTGWKEEDCEFSNSYIHLSKKLEENQRANWEILLVKRYKDDEVSLEADQIFKDLPSLNTRD